MAIQHRLFASVTELNLAAAELLAEQAGMERDRPGLVMLSGGRTPKAVFDEVIRRGTRAGRELVLCYSDERYVPAESAESNYGCSRALIAALGIVPSRVIRVETERCWELAAERYEHDLRKCLAGGGVPCLGLLGLGPDGHTASLFTPSDVQAGEHRWAIPVKRPQPPDRISVTPGFLQSFRRIVILASGDDKRAIVAKLLATPDQVVAGLALRNCRNVELWQA